MLGALLITGALVVAYNAANGEHEAHMHNAGKHKHVRCGGTIVPNPHWWHPYVKFSHPHGGPNPSPCDIYAAHTRELAERAKQHEGAAIASRGLRP